MVPDERHDTLRRAYRSLNDGDLEAVLDFLGDDFELEPSWDSAPRGVYRGREAIRAVLEAWAQPFDSLTYEVERMVDGAEDCVVVLIKLSAVPRGTNAPTQVGISHVWRYEELNPVSLRVYFGRSAGLEAGGISSEDA